LFVLPFFALFIPLGAGAVVFAIVMAFVKWPIGGSPSYVGMANFDAVRADPVFRTALWNTAWMLFAYLAILLPLAVAVATALNQPRVRGRRIFQLGFFLPITASLVVVALVFQLLYDDQVGLLDGVLRDLHLPTIPFLTSPSVAPWSIIALRLWRVVGYYAVILYAGMQAIPPELYEAAAADGAGPWRRFRHITMPLLRPMTLFVAVAASVGAWELFAEPQLLTDGGPARATVTAVMYVYQTSFLSFQLGQGAAAAAILAVCVIATTLLLQRALRSKT
jgi:ABC-type sugar transport system permease subunit